MWWISCAKKLILFCILILSQKLLKLISVIYRGRLILVHLSLHMNSPITKQNIISLHVGFLSCLSSLVLYRRVVWQLLSIVISPLFLGSLCRPYRYLFAKCMSSRTSCVSFPTHVPFNDIFLKQYLYFILFAHLPFFNLFFLTN